MSCTFGTLSRDRPFGLPPSKGVGSLAVRADLGLRRATRKRTSFRQIDVNAAVAYVIRHLSFVIATSQVPS